MHEFQLSDSDGKEKNNLNTLEKQEKHDLIIWEEWW